MGLENSLADAPACHGLSHALAVQALPPSSMILSVSDRMGAATVIQLGEMLMILDLHRQGLSISAIARRTGRDPKTIRKYIARGLEPPAYGPRQVGRPGKLAPYLDYLRERIAAFPDLSAVRLTREIRERGYQGAYTAVKRFLATTRPADGPSPSRSASRRRPASRPRSTSPASSPPSPTSRR